MLTPEEFPYIKSLHVNDCYAYQNFDIELHNYKPFSHLILTGKNGSGKSTILRVIDNHMSYWRAAANSSLVSITSPIDIIDRLNAIIPNRAAQFGINDSVLVTWKKELDQVDRLSLSYTNLPNNIWTQNKLKTIYSFLKAKRDSHVVSVDTVTKELDFINQLQNNNSTEAFIRQFKQYLVNKKVYQAFDQIKQDQTRFAETDQFFDRLTESFRQIFEDTGLVLTFQQEYFEFFIQLSDGRQLTFDVLSEGFSALLSILMDLFMRVDLIRKQVGDYSYDPCGIVLIDEPETHLHLQLQEQVLPLLTSLFPNIQFIAATHSPAVIASIKNATIFDLTTKESRGSEETVGRSYSDLMRGHFGLSNEYSSIADDLFRQIDSILKESKDQPEALKAKLQQFFVENDAYLSPSFRVELESMILENA